MDMAGARRHEPLSLCSLPVTPLDEHIWAMLGFLQDLRLTHTHVADACNFGQSVRGVEEWMSYVWALMPVPTC